ncbi:TPA: hypothetical protein RMY99_004222 [Salmonella enterica subsp. enterica serovar Typhi]|nr:hypothetical protein [Salmonella enterica subsp. enterica serovar Typhi]HDW6064707.1 hypothetical protein [Salmonella enterica subsp. enterica serovar Typhi]
MTESSDYESVQVFIGVDVGKDTHHPPAVCPASASGYFYLTSVLAPSASAQHTSRPSGH